MFHNGILFNHHLGHRGLSRKQCPKPSKVTRRIERCHLGLGFGSSEIKVFRVWGGVAALLPDP